jgi:hypothetical protein
MHELPRLRDLRREYIELKAQEQSDSEMSTGYTDKSAMHFWHHARIYMREYDAFGEVADIGRHHSDGLYYYTIRLDTGGLIYKVIDADLWHEANVNMEMTK